MNNLITHFGRARQLLHYYTIQYLLSRFGFRIIHHETALFSLSEFAVKSEINPTLKGAQQEIVQVRNYVEEFQFKWLKTFIEKHSSEQLMMYGCGARSSNFINLLDLSEYFPVLLMIKKQGKVVRNFPLSWKRKEFLFVKHISFGVNSESESLLIKKHGLKDFQCFTESSSPNCWRIS